MFSAVPAVLFYIGFLAVVVGAFGCGEPVGKWGPRSMVSGAVVMLLGLLLPLLTG